MNLYTPHQAKRWAALLIATEALLRHRQPTGSRVGFGGAPAHVVGRGSGVTPASIGNLTFSLSAKVGATTLDGTDGSWLERVSGVAMGVAGADPDPTYGATAWDGTRPSVDFGTGTSSRVRDNATLSAPTILPNPCTVAMVLDNPEVTLTSVFGSEDDTARFSIDNNQLRAVYGNTTSDNLHTLDVSGKILVFFTINGTAANVYVNGVAGNGNPGVVVNTPPAAGGIVIGSKWGGASNTESEIAAIDVWSKVLIAAQKNALANTFYRRAWDNLFGGIWAL